MRVTPSAISIDQGETAILSSELVKEGEGPLAGSSPQYSSSDTAIVLVDAAGVVSTAGPAGAAEIIVSIDSYSLAVSVTVNQLISTIEVPGSLAVMLDGCEIKQLVES